MCIRDRAKTSCLETNRFIIFRCSCCSIVNVTDWWSKGERFESSSDPVTKVLMRWLQIGEARVKTWRNFINVSQTINLIALCYTLQEGKLGKAKVRCDSPQGKIGNHRARAGLIRHLKARTHLAGNPSHISRTVLAKRWLTWQGKENMPWTWRALYVTKKSRKTKFLQIF